MQTKKSNVIVILFVSFIFFNGCKSANIPNDIFYEERFMSEEYVKNYKTLVLVLWEEDFNKNIEIRNSKDLLVYRNKSVKGKSHMIDIAIPENETYFIIKYNKKKYKLLIQPKYVYLVIGFRADSQLDVGYTNRKPFYMD